MNENKTSKYFKYAIGEILLVVVGILIAIQINNKYAEVKERDLEKKYLKSLVANLEEDLIELEYHFIQDTLFLDAYSSMMKVMLYDSINVSTPDIEKKFLKTFYQHYFEGNNVVFEDMKFSGKLNLIRRDSLKFQIQKYYRTFEEYKALEMENNNQILSQREKLRNLVKASTIVEPLMPERWKVDLGPQDMSFVKLSNNHPTAQKLLDIWSLMKVHQLVNHNYRIDFHKLSLNLKEDINTYLSQDW